MRPAAIVPFADRGSVGRYLALGAANTALTFLLLTGLQQITAVSVAYTVAFAAGVAFSTALSAQVVFRVPGTRARRAGFACCYGVIYCVGLLVSCAVHGFAAPWQVSAAAIAVTAPLGYLAGRCVLVPRPRGTRRSP